ncbi:MAG TPA: non-heme iron oxygenase ferredoxin subunit [Acidimicrobiales bacterium]|nr:non-heme iron oxygenase ferredoxin subunit [Acidimicrobiales bacterium]
MSAQRVCAVSDVAPGTARQFVVDGQKIAVVRIGDDWYAIGDTCTHQRISLADGEVHPETREIECWKHGSCFSLETGEPSSLPATKAEPVYQMRVHGEDVLVDLVDVRDESVVEVP